MKSKGPRNYVLLLKQKQADEKARRMKKMLGQSPTTKPFPIRRQGKGKS